MTLYIDIGARRYSGWQSLSIVSDLNCLSSTFALVGSNLFADAIAIQAFKAGSPCLLWDDDDLLLTGSVYETDASLAKGTHSVRLVGKSLTGDLVNCSALPPPNMWRGQTALQIAQALATPFGVTAWSDLALQPISRFRLQRGDSVFDALSRLAKKEKLLVTDDDLGQLVLTRGSNEFTDPLPQPLAIDVSNSLEGVHSPIVVKGQIASTDDTNGLLASQPFGVSTDLGAIRYRPLIVTPEGRANPQECLAIARWETLTRLGQSVRVSVTLQGWRNPSGDIWPVNKRTVVSQPLVGIQGAFLIVRRELSVSRSDGRICKLDLAIPEAYQAFDPNVTVVRRVTTLW